MKKIISIAIALMLMTVSLTSVLAEGIIDFTGYTWMNCLRSGLSCLKRSRNARAVKR